MVYVKSVNKGPKNGPYIFIKVNIIKATNNKINSISKILLKKPPTLKNPKENFLSLIGYKIGIPDFVNKSPRNKWDAYPIVPKKDKLDILDNNSICFNINEIIKTASKLCESFLCFNQGNIDRIILNKMK